MSLVTVRRTLEADSFGRTLEYVATCTKEVSQLLPLIIEVCTPAQAQSAQTISDIWRAVAEGHEQYQQQQQQRERHPTGMDPDDDEGPFTG
jgi:hypothetical protein